MKKFFKWLLLLCLIFCASCGDRYNDNLDGVAFDYYSECQIENNSYKIYLPNKANESLLYLYEESEQTSNAEMWIVNFMYTNKYLQTSELSENAPLWDGLYSFLLTNKNHIDSIVGFNTSIYKDNFQEEREFVFENKDNKVITYVSVDYYLPVRINDVTNSSTFTIFIPIFSKYLLKENNSIQSPFEDKTISFDDFLNIENMERKN